MIQKRTGQSQFSCKTVPCHIRAHIRAQQEGIVQFTARCPARSPHIRPQRKFACSSSFQISFIFVPSFPAFSHSSTNPGISISIPHKVCGFVVRIISPNTQFVNRLIPLFSRMYFLHDISACAARIFCTVWQKRSPLPVHCRRILHAKDRVSSAGSDKAWPFAVFGLGYRRNHVPERGLAALPLPVIL